MVGSGSTRPWWTAVGALALLAATLLCVLTIPSTTWSATTTRDGGPRQIVSYDLAGNTLITPIQQVTTHLSYRLDGWGTETAVSSQTGRTEYPHWGPKFGLIYAIGAGFVLIALGVAAWSWHSPRRRATAGVVATAVATALVVITVTQGLALLARADQFDRADRVLTQERQHTSFIFEAGWYFGVAASALAVLGAAVLVYAGRRPNRLETATP